VRMDVGQRQMVRRNEQEEISGPAAVKTDSDKETRIQGVG